MAKPVIDWSLPYDPKVSRKRRTGKLKYNPLLRIYGEAEGKQCRTCIHLEGHQMGGRWFKCDLRTPGGPATDHNATWPACGRHEEDP